MDQLSIGTMVRVHKNLRRGDWSVSIKGKVVAHVATIALSDCTFKVSEARRQAVIRAHCREVHAWTIGTIAAAPSAGNAVPITYNPFRAAYFHRCDDGAEVTRCEAIHFIGGGIALAYGKVT